MEYVLLKICQKFKRGQDNYLSAKNGENICHLNICNSNSCGEKVVGLNQTFSAFLD